jgi:hypothetical protein
MIVLLQPILSYFGSELLVSMSMGTSAQYLGGWDVTTLESATTDLFSTMIVHSSQIFYTDLDFIYSSATCLQGCGQRDRRHISYQWKLERFLHCGRWLEHWQCTEYVLCSDHLHTLLN